MSDLSVEVSTRFLAAAAKRAAIVLREEGDNLTVSGPYQEMVDIIKTLKTRGFRFDSMRKVWWAPKTKITGRKLKNLQNLVDRANKGDPKAEEAKRKEFEEAVSKHLTGFRFFFQGIDHSHVFLSGETFKVRGEAKTANGTWRGTIGAWEFGERVDLRGFQKLVDRCEHLSKIWEKKLKDIEKFLDKPREWPNLRVTMSYNEGKKTILISGNTKPIKDSIKHLIPEIRYDAVGWWVGALKTKIDELEDLCKDLDQEEAKAKEKAEAEQPEHLVGQPAPQDTPKVNRKGDYCLNCGGWVEPGKGYLVWYYDYEPGDFVWKVRHKDPHRCEEVKEAVKVRSEKARTKQQAVRSLRDLSTKSEYYVEGTRHRPPGKTVYINSKSIGYGGGEWVVIEPNEKYFWYVINNGADGDDWRSNNVSTGGAGAIGYRLPFSDEARTLLEVAKES
jgi:hypothetical protein